MSIFLSPLDHILTNRGKVRLLRALTPLSRPVSGREAAKLARRLSQTPALRALDDLVALGVLRRTETPSQHLYEVNRAHQLVREGLEPLFRAEQERIGRVLDVLSEVAPRASIRRRRSDTGRWENHCSEAPGPWSSSRTWIGR